MASLHNPVMLVEEHTARKFRSMMILIRNLAVLVAEKANTMVHAEPAAGPPHQE